MEHRRLMYVSLGFAAIAAGLMLIWHVTGGGFFLERQPLRAIGVQVPRASPQLILPLEVDLIAAQQFVKLGFGLEVDGRFQSTKFLTPWLRTSQAQKIVSLVKEYGNFDGERVATTLGAFRGRIRTIEFGREGSPVLYIELPYWTNQREEVQASGAGQRISEKDNDALVDELREAFQVKLRADEFSVDERRVRVWWHH